MNFNNLLLTDTAGKKSTTLTVFVSGSLVVHVKLLLAGMVINGYAFSAFSGSEYAAAMGALGAIYVLRRSTDPNNKPSNS
jgi:hypothetical protein